MNIIEAAKSGKPFKRKKHAIWLREIGLGEGGQLSFYVQDLLADDWEVEEEKTITRERLKLALNLAGSPTPVHGVFVTDVWENL